MELRLPVTGKLDVAHSLAVLSLHSLPQQEFLDVATAQLRRVLQLNEHLVEATIFFERNEIQVHHDAPATLLPQLKAILNHWLGLTQDTTKAYNALRQSPGYCALAQAHPNLRLISYPDPFEALAITVLGQQVSIAAARTLAGRYVEKLGQLHPTGLHAFPTAQATRTCTPEQLREIIRCPFSRASTLQRVADWYCEVGTTLLSDPAKFLTRLQLIRGVGPWTRNYMALRGLREEDVFLQSDLVVRRALARLEASEVRVTAPPSGAGSLATVLLWAHDADKL